jgi:hypothetical protein
MDVLSADELTHVLGLMSVEDDLADHLRQVALVSRAFCTSARAVASTIWNGDGAELHDLLLSLARADARLQGIDAQIFQLQRSEHNGEIETDPAFHAVSDLEGSYSEAADEVVAAAQRVGDGVWFAPPLACLLHDARLLVLFATGALRLLRNPWSAANLKQLGLRVKG